MDRYYRLGKTSPQAQLQTIRAKERRDHIWVNYSQEDLQNLKRFIELQISHGHPETTICFTGELSEPFAMSAEGEEMPIPAQALQA